MNNLYKFWGIIAVGVVTMAGLSGCNTLQSIEISREPVQTVYGQGQELDRSGLGVTAHYKKNSEDVSNMSLLQISGYDKGKPGQQTVTVTMKKQSATFTVMVARAEKVSIRQPPATTVFMQGDDFNPAGLTALVEFENGAVPGESVGPDRLNISGYDKDKAGAQTLTADYYGKQASFKVTVAPLTKLVVTSPPKKVEYFTGEDLDMAGLVVTGVWEGMGEKTVNITQGNLSNFDKNNAGKQEVLVTYQRKTASFPVTFVAMQALSIARPPSKLRYENGEELNINGLSVQGTRMGATSIELVDVSRLKISGYDRFKAGDQTITVTLGGKTTTFTVTVAPDLFVGTWHGEKTETEGYAVKKLEMTLEMTEDSWKLIRKYAGDEYSGTYTRDSDRKHARLHLMKSGAESGVAPTSAEILSPTTLKLIGGVFGQGGLVFTKWW